MALLVVHPALAQRQFGDTYGGARQSIAMYVQQQQFASYRSTPAPIVTRFDQQVWRPAPTYSSTDRLAREPAPHATVAAYTPPPLLVPFGDSIGRRIPARDPRVIADDILAAAAHSSEASPSDSSGASMRESRDSSQMLERALGCLKDRKGASDDTCAFEAASQAASSGDVRAQALLGDLYVYGIGVSRDARRGLEWLGRAADSGNVAAQLRYARVLLETDARPGDYATALRYAERAATRRAEANFEVGLILTRDRPGVQHDPERAAAAFERAARAGHAASQFLYATCLQAGMGVPRNLAAAVGWLQSAADRGLPYAKLRLGLAYYYGDGVQPDHPRALALLQEAAEQRQPGAANALGLLYSDGVGIPRDPARATEYFRMGAEQGDRDAQLNLGAAYFLGRGVAVNESEAARWLAPSAEGGNPLARYMLGMLYLSGSGVGLDVPRAVADLRQSSTAGFPPATDLLCELAMRERSGLDFTSPEFTPTLQAGLAADQPACLYAQARRLGDGILMVRDVAAATKLLMRSADLGFHQAEFELGMTYLELAGTVDPAQRRELEATARDWLTRAANHGNAHAGQMLDQRGWR